MVPKALMVGAPHRSASFTGRSAEMLRVAHRLAFALVAMLMCAGILSSTRGMSSSLVALEASTFPNGASTQRAGEADRQIQPLDRSTPLLVELKEVESDTDEVDTRCDAGNSHAIAIEERSLWREIGRALDGEEQLEPSRASTNSHLARGPPALRS